MPNNLTTGVFVDFRTYYLSLSAPMEEAGSTATVSGYFSQTTDLSEPVMVAVAIDTSRFAGNETASGFETDLNGDGNVTDLDYQIGAFEAVVASLTATAAHPNIEIALISYDQTATVNFVGAVDEDEDGNGIADAVDRARELRSAAVVNAVDHADPLNTAAQLFRDNGTSIDNTLLFVAASASDTPFETAAADVRDLADVRTFAITENADPTQLDLIDDGEANGSEFASRSTLLTDIVRTPTSFADFSSLNLSVDGDEVATINSEGFRTTPIGFSYATSVPLDDTAIDTVAATFVFADDGVPIGEETLRLAIDQPLPPSYESTTFFTFENETTVDVGFASDPNGDTVSYRLAPGGAGNAAFSLAADGTLTFLAPPDFEAPADADGDNTYVISVGASDGTLESVTTLTIDVFNRDEEPDFGSVADPTVAEGTFVVGTFAAVDPEGDAVTYSVVGGTDVEAFDIGPTTGVLSFELRPDFESPDDANGDNVYTVVIRAFAGAESPSADLTLNVTVSDVDEPPVFGDVDFTEFVSENQTAAAAFNGFDPEGNDVTFALGGLGADDGLFSIDAASGVVTFNAAPDFEDPDDSDEDNTYELSIVLSDGALTTVETATVTVLDENEAPVFLVDGLVTVSEGTTPVDTFTAADPEGFPVGYSISDGPDAALFSINAETGAVAFLAPPDAEAPGDDDGDNVYEFAVRAVPSADDFQLAGTLDVAVTVGEVDEPPVLGPVFGSIVLVPEGTEEAVATLSATDPEGQDVTFTLLPGSDGATFVIDPLTNEIAFVAPPDFENPADGDLNNFYEISIEASDGVESTVGSLTVQVANLNDAPVFNVGDTATVPEGTTVVGPITATDPEGGLLAYSIAGGADADAFAINPSTGVLSFLVAPDFEDPADIGFDNVYDVTIRATEVILAAAPFNQGPGPASTTLDLAVSVSDVNEAPEFDPNALTFAVPENETAVGTLVAVDPEGGAVTYAIADDEPDGALFDVDTATGVLSFLAPPNAEAPADANGDNVYEIVVIASDGFNAPRTLATVTVVDENEAPVFDPFANPSVVEGELAVGTFTATDEDFDSVTYAIVGGADAAAFEIGEFSGDLAFLTAPDFEDEGDANEDNVYELTIAATDGRLTTLQPLAVSVLDNEAPVFEGPADLVITEGADTELAFIATDEDAVAYTIVGGEDADEVFINSETGVVDFEFGPDFELPLDADEDNIYRFVIAATDGNETTTLEASIEVLDREEAGQVFQTDENTLDVGLVDTSEFDGSSPTVTIVGGPDEDLFDIIDDQGAPRIVFIAPPDFEQPDDADTDNEYRFNIRLSEGEVLDSSNVVVTVLNVNEGPAIVSDPVFSVTENALAVGTVEAIDPDIADTLTFALSGTDADRFTIDNTGAVTFAAAPDFETPADADTNNVYQLTVLVSDGELTDFQDIAVTVEDANEAPVIAPPVAFTEAENIREIGTIAADDPDGDALTYAVIGGADAASVTINATTGFLSFVDTPDFEAPADADLDNVYEVLVEASDGALSDTASVTVTVTDVEPEPVPDAVDDAFPLDAGPSILESEAEGDVDGNVLANDVDPDGTLLGVVAVNGLSAAVGTAVAGSAGGTFTIGSDGGLDFSANGEFEDLADGQTRTTTVTYTAQFGDPDGGPPVEDTATVTVTVTGLDEPSNAAPIARDDRYAVAPGTTLNVSTALGLLANDFDAEGDPFTAQQLSTPSRGTLALEADGSFTYDAPSDFEGTIIFTYAANDGNGALRLGDPAAGAGGQDVAIVRLVVTDDPTPLTFVRQRGDDGNDRLIGGDDPDQIAGNGGDDRIVTGANRDRAVGGDGNDWLFGQDGDDTIGGGDGDDALFGGAGDDTLFAGGGDDSLFGAFGDDLLAGDGGDDTLRGQQGNDSLFGGADDDALIDESGDNELWGQEGNDSLFAGTGNDTLIGDVGDDLLRGGDGNDVLFGNAGDDTLAGDGGANVLNGGAGADSLEVADGANRIVFEAAFGNDSVVGFGFDDRLDFSGVATVSSFANVITGTDAFGNALISTSEGTITLIGISPTFVSAALFDF